MPYIEYCSPIKELHRFLDMLNFCRHFIPRAANNKASLHKLLSDSAMKPSNLIIWTEEEHGGSYLGSDRFLCLSSLAETGCGTPDTTTE